MMSVYVLLEVGEGKTDDIVVIALNVVYIFTKGSLDCVSAGLIIRFIRFDVRRLPVTIPKLVLFFFPAACYNGIIKRSASYPADRGEGFCFLW